MWVSYNNFYESRISICHMADNANIILSILRKICNYIRNVSGKHAILPEYAVQNQGTGQMEA